MSLEHLCEQWRAQKRAEESARDALELEPARELRDGHPALDVLGARHRHGAVGEELVRDVRAGGDGGADADDGPP